MGMQYRLSSSHAIVETDVEAVWSASRQQMLAHFRDQLPYRHLFRAGQFVDAAHVFSRDDKGVTPP